MDADAQFQGNMIAKHDDLSGVPLVVSAPCSWSC